jgi:hypothetical protein
MSALSAASEAREEIERGTFQPFTLSVLWTDCSNRIE